MHLRSLGTNPQSALGHGLGSRNGKMTGDVAQGDFVNHFARFCRPGRQTHVLFLNADQCGRRPDPSCPV